jgi:hypothetical protein
LRFERNKKVHSLEEDKMTSKQGDDGIFQVPSTYILLLNLEDIPPIEPQNSSQRLVELLKLGHLRNSSQQRENQR